METMLDRLLTQAGACAWGVADGDALLSVMPEDARARALERVPGLRRLLCAAFPYARGDEGRGPISLYARGEDYHAVLRRRLEPVQRALEARFPGEVFSFFSDVSPFPEVYAAALAGVGKLGDNGLLITESAGSYVFLATLATGADLPVTGDGTVTRCRGCGACRKRCPAGCCGEESRVRCLSALTQRRGALSPQETALVQKNGMLWGCDECQRCCPENGGLTAVPLPEFAPLPELGEGDLLLSDRAFRRKYAGRAFVWRGVQPLRRNGAILSAQPSGETDPQK